MNNEQLRQALEARVDYLASTVPLLKGERSVVSMYYDNRGTFLNGTPLNIGARITHAAETDKNLKTVLEVIFVGFASNFPERAKELFSNIQKNEGKNK